MASFAHMNADRTAQGTLPGATDFLGIASGFRGLRLIIQAIADHRAERRERFAMARELASYSDHELGEMGFSRADLPAIAAGTYRR
jgi:uncharacterized protein YjiS (DUF1127 family)